MILIPLIWTTVYALTNLLLGFMLLKLWLKNRFCEYTILTILVASFLLGQGILTGVWLILGVLGWFSQPVILGILTLIMLASVFIWHELIIFFKTITQNTFLQFKKLSIFWKLLALMILSLVLFLAVGTIVLPPSGDAAGFYMVLPKIMAYTGKLIPQPNQYEFSKVSLLGEMHFAALMVVADSVAAKFFVWFNALATAGVLLGLGRLINLKTKGQIITLAILFTSVTFTVYMTNGKVDIFGVAYGLAAYYWVLKAKSKSWLPLILTGLFLGLAVMAKLSNALVIIPGILLILGWHRYLNYKDGQGSIKDLIKETLYSWVIVGAFCILALTPHFIKNEVIFNNPLVTPYSSGQSPQMLNPIWSSGHNFFTVFLTSPIALVFWENPTLNDNLSILVLVFLPLLFFGYPKNTVQKQILAMALLGLTIWLVACSKVAIPRYYLATLCLYLPIIAAGTENILIQKNYFWLKLVITGSIFLVILGFLVTHFYMIKTFSQVVRGQPNTLTLNSPSYASLQFLNQKAAHGDRVYVTGYFVFYLMPELLVNMGATEGLNNLATINQDSTWEYLFNRGFKYVVIQKADDWSYIDGLRSGAKPDWLKIEKIYSEPDAALYSTDIYSIEKK